MNLNKIIDKLDEFFGLSKSKQLKKHEKLLAIINKLEGKKSKLKKIIKAEGEKDETSDAYNSASKELKVISKLIKKVKKQDISNTNNN